MPVISYFGLEPRGTQLCPHCGKALRPQPDLSSGKPRHIWYCTGQLIACAPVDSRWVGSPFHAAQARKQQEQAFSDWLNDFDFEDILKY